MMCHLQCTTHFARPETARFAVRAHSVAAQHAAHFHATARPERTVLHLLLHRLRDGSAAATVAVAVLLLLLLLFAAGATSACLTGICRTNQDTLAKHTRIL